MPITPPPPPESEDLRDLGGETMVLNMGPSHPSTHGVLRLVLEVDGEVITAVTPDIGYLHRGDEKIAENMTYTQFIPYTDRLDYLAPLANNVAYALAVEKLLGIDRQLPLRCQYIRVLCCELARISSHLLGLGLLRHGPRGDDRLSAHVHRAGEDLQPVRVADRRAVHHELHAHRRAGARSACRAGSISAVASCVRCRPPFATSRQLLTRNRIWVDRTRDVGVISRDEAIAYGLTGPNLRGSGVDYDLRKAHPYLVYDRLEFDVPIGSVGDCYDRYLVRMEEMRQSVRIGHQCLDQMPDGPDQRGRRQDRAPAEGEGPHPDGGTHPPVHAGHARA